MLLWEFISAPCVSNIQGFATVILILQAPRPLRPPSSTKSPCAERGDLKSPCSHRRCRRNNFGNYVCERSRVAVTEGEMLEAITRWRLPLSGMIWGKQPYHRLAAFAGDWARGEAEENRGQADLPTSWLINVQRGFYYSLEVTRSKPLPPMNGTLPI